MFQCLNGVRHCAILRGPKQGHFEMETTQFKKKILGTGTRLPLVYNIHSYTVGCVLITWLIILISIFEVSLGEMLNPESSQSPKK